MYNRPQQPSEQSLFNKDKRYKENDSKYLNAIKPYVKQRKLSKRQLKNLMTPSPIDNNKSKIKKSNDTSSRKNHIDQITGNSRCLSDAYIQLKTLKSDFKVLKDSYNCLRKQNEQLTARGTVQNEELMKELNKYKKQVQKNKNNIVFLEQQIERLKKQCFKLVETEIFKHKKLEETIQEKELMIAYLRSQLAVLNGDPVTNNSIFLFQHTTPTYKNMNPATNHQNVLSKISINQSVISNNRIDIDLPRQIPTHNKRQKRVDSTQIQKGQHIQDSALQVSRIDKPNKSVGGKSILKQSPNISSIKHKRQYVFSNSDDSFSFSREKSKQQSIVSEGQPTILTFTKKDVIVFDQDEEINQQNSNESEIEQCAQKYKNIIIQQNFIDEKDIEEIQEISGREESMLQSSENQVGQQQLPTFQNRFNAIGMANNWNLAQETEIISQNNISKKKIGAKQKNVRHRLPISKKIDGGDNSQKKVNLNQGSSGMLKSAKIKSKPQTKRPLQIHTDDEGIYGSQTEKNEHNVALSHLCDGESSEINRKKYRNKKKNNNPVVNRKRKSQEAGTIHKK